MSLYNYSYVVIGEFEVDYQYTTCAFCWNPLHGEALS